MIPESLLIFHHEDHLSGGSVDTDDTGNILQLLDYYPFGETRVDESSEEYENDYKFTGKELDEDTKLYYYEARYYDPSLARFISVDPMAKFAHEKFLQDPQQLNYYSYARNNPLKYVDTTGQYAETLFDLANVVVDAVGVVYNTGKVIGAGIAYGVGAYKDDQYLKDASLKALKESGKKLGGSAVDLTADVAATVIPVVPAGITKLDNLNDAGKAIGKANDTKKTIDNVSDVSKTSKNIKGYTEHGLNQKINREVKSQDVLDAVKNPLDTKPVIIDAQGRSSQRFIGQKAEVVINPKTKNVVSVNPTSSKKSENLKKKNNNGK